MAHVSNCKNCAAPFAARDAERCEYCGTLIDQPRPEYADAVRRSAMLASQTIAGFSTGGTVSATPPPSSFWSTAMAAGLACFVGFRR